MRCVVQPDVVQPFQGDGLDWSEFAVFMKVEDIPNTEKILRAYTPEQVLKMQQALFRMRRRFAWSSTNFNPFRDMGTQVGACWCWCCWCCACYLPTCVHARHMRSDVFLRMSLCRGLACVLCCSGGMAAFERV